MTFRITHNRTLKTRLLSAFLVLTAWLVSWCVIMEPSHACCKQMAERSSTTLPACCTGPWQAQSADSSAGHGFDPGHWVTQPHFNSLDFIRTVTTDSQQSALAKAYTPDQSGRYLELRVLLN